MATNRPQPIRRGRRRDASAARTRCSGPSATTSSKSSANRARPCRAARKTGSPRANIFRSTSMRAARPEWLSAQPAVVSGSPGSAGNGCDSEREQPARDPRAADRRRAIVAPAGRAVIAARGRCARLRTLRVQALSALCVISLAPVFSVSFFRLARRRQIRFRHHARETAEGSQAQRVRDSHRAGPRETHFHRARKRSGSSRKAGQQAGPERARDGNRFRLPRRHALPKNAIALRSRRSRLLTLTLPNELPAREHELALNFNGKINPQGQGLFYARYQEQGSGRRKRSCSGRNSKPTDARRLFPCWDEPSFRARFQLTAVVAENFTAVSNMPVEARKRRRQAREVRLRALLPRCRAICVVLCAGRARFDRRRTGWSEAPRRRRPKAKRRWAVTRSRARRRFCIITTNTSACLIRCRNSISSRVPGGFGGAMENWGGITYYESVLLFDPKNSSTKPSRTSSQSSRTRWRTNGSAISSRWRGGTIFG